MTLGPWWSVLAGMLAGIFISGLVLAIPTPSRKYGKRILAASCVVGCALAIAYTLSPDAPKTSGVINKQLDKIEKKLGG